MIKLIASDLDGTLVPEATPDINPRLFERILQLKERGIRFVVASGRQYPSILDVFEPLRNDIFFIADNGAFVVEKDRYLRSITFPDETWKGIISLVHTFPGTRIMLSSEEGNYTDSTDMWFRNMVSENLGLDLIFVEDFQKLSLHVSKIGVYCTERNPRDAALLGKQHFEGKANIVVSGDFWMDYVPLDADKGKALTKLMEHLGISREETIAFGDNINDIGLLRAAGDSYAVVKAAPELKAIAGHVLTEGPEDDGVLHVLEQFLAGEVQ